jgi:peptidoglycan/xylan/chitin deacetylase (PgdA/CDA1 family)
MKKILLILLAVFIFTSNASANIKYSNDIIYKNTYYETVINNLKRQPTILIFTYHLISDNEKLWSDYVIPTQKFEQDIQYLQKKGFIFVTMSKLYRIKKNPDKYKNKNIVALTFDDGYKSDYELVYPILKKYNVPATLFITGSYIGEEKYLTKAQLLELSKSSLVEIGNHSYEKHRLSKMELLKEFEDEATYYSVLADFMKNRDFIYSITNKKPTSLSYPYGVYNEKADEYFKKNGFNISVGTYPKNNISSTLSLPLYRINRSNNDNLFKLALDYWT